MKLLMQILVQTFAIAAVNVAPALADYTVPKSAWASDEELEKVTSAFKEFLGLATVVMGLIVALFE